MKVVNQNGTLYIDIPWDSRRLKTSRKVRNTRGL